MKAKTQIQAITEALVNGEKISGLAPDAIREEEVLASLVLVPGETASDALCQELFAFCQKEMAYYKVPGWWWFTDEIPTTGTQKIQKHRILQAGQDPTTLPGIRDLRTRKKRG